MNHLHFGSGGPPFIFRKLCTLKSDPNGALQVYSLGLKFSESKVQTNRNSLKRHSSIMITLSIVLLAIGVTGGPSVITLIYDVTVASLLWVWMSVYLAASWIGRKE